MRCNGERNRDGHSENFSDNNGIEGATDDVEVNALRLKQQKNMLLTLLFSQGVPMLSAGTEIGHSQQGNNNAYCQDNNINYLASKNEVYTFDLQAFISAAIKLRKQFSVFQQSRFVHQDDSEFSWLWLKADSELMTENNWQEVDNQLLILLIINKQHATPLIGNDALLMFFNGASTDKEVSLPLVSGVSRWQVRLDSLAESRENVSYTSEDKLVIAARSIYLMSPITA